MTNEDAIKWLDNLKNDLGNPHYECLWPYAQALDEIGEMLDEAPTVGGWISVKDGTPDEHDSIFAKHTHLSKYMWAKESDDVIVYVRFPDGSGRSTEGRLRDGKWHTKISPTLESVVTHWMPFPEPPKE